MALSSTDVWVWVCMCVSACVRVYVMFDLRWHTLCQNDMVKSGESCHCQYQA